MPERQITILFATYNGANSLPLMLEALLRAVTVNRLGR